MSRKVADVSVDTIDMGNTFVGATRRVAPTRDVRGLRPLTTPFMESTGPPQAGGENGLASGRGCRDSGPQMD